MPTSPASLQQFSSRCTGRRPLARFAAVGLAVFAFTIPGCYPARKADAEVAVICRTTPDPPQTGPTLISCEVSDAAGNRVQANDVRLEANMSHPGMQPVLASMTQSASGGYEAQIAFTMAGDWYLVVSGESDDHGRFEETVNLPGVRSR